MYFLESLNNKISLYILRVENYLHSKENLKKFPSVNSKSLFETHSAVLSKIYYSNFNFFFPKPIYTIYINSPIFTKKILNILIFKRIFLGIINYKSNLQLPTPTGVGGNLKRVVFMMCIFSLRSN